VLVSPEVARDLPRTRVKILGQAEAPKLADNGRIDVTYTGARWSGPRAFAEAGVTPADVDYASIYDSFTITVVETLEDLGFCAKGEGPQFVRDHTFTVDGTFPHNTSGGQLSVGQAGAAGGFLGLTDAIRQLTGTALGEAVGNARVGLVSGFGMINYDRGLCCGAAILARGAA
jgi:acetyl-CoA acetyltransferase